MEKEFEGNIKGFGFNKETDANKWASKSNEILKKNKAPYRVVNNYELNFFKILSLLLFFSLLVFFGFMLYFIDEGKFKDNINQPINMTNHFTPETNNEYAYSSKTDNNFNNTFNFKFNIDKELIKVYCNNTINST